jgi:hypothetical protein
MSYTCRPPALKQSRKVITQLFTLVISENFKQALDSAAAHSLTVPRGSCGRRAPLLKQRAREQGERQVQFLVCLHTHRVEPMLGCAQLLPHRLNSLRHAGIKTFACICICICICWRRSAFIIVQIVLLQISIIIGQLKLVEPHRLANLREKLH